MDTQSVIGITGTGSLLGQGIIRSVIDLPNRSSVRIIGYDYFENTIGSYWVDKTYIMPDFLKNDVSLDRWLNMVIDSINREGIDILLIGNDFELKPFADNISLIKQGASKKIDVVISSPRVIDIANDKYLTYRFLRENNLPYPETYLPEEVKDVAIQFPCIVKPRYGARSRGVYRVENEYALNQRVKTIKNPIVQELVGDDDKEYTCGVIFLNGEVKDSIALRRTLKDGNTENAYYKAHTPQAVTEYILAITRCLKPYGPCNLQIRIDHQGVPKLFEINGRFSGTTYIRSLFGFKEVQYIVNYLLGIPNHPFILKEGQAKRYYTEMFIEA